MDRIEDTGDEVESPDEADVNTAEDPGRGPDDGASAEERRRDAYRLW